MSPLLWARHWGLGEEQGSSVPLLTELAFYGGGGAGRTKHTQQLSDIPEAMRPNDRGDLVQTGGGVTEGWMKKGERTFQAEGTARAKAPRCEAVWPL